MPQSKTRKKTAAGTGSIRKITKTRNGKNYSYWESRFTVGYDPNTGKQIQRSISGKTQKEVAQKLKAATAAIDAGTYIPPCKETLASWLDMWFSEYLGGIKPLTVANYEIQINKHLKPGLGTIRLDNLNPHTIQRFYNGLGNGEIATLSPKTVKNIHGVLHKALHQAVLNGYIRTNPADACVLPKIQKPEIRPLEHEQIVSLLKELPDEAYGNLFLVALFTGMRQGELLGLSWEAVDFKSGIITVKQQLQRKDGAYFLCAPKSGKPRMIAPAPFVLDALKQEQRKQQENRKNAGSLWENKWNLVFTDAIGKNLVRRTVDKHFKNIVENSGLESCRFHDLRHTYAVNSLQAGDDIKTVQANLGHATAAFTLDVYGHVSEKMRRDSANRMQQFYEQMTER